MLLTSLFWFLERCSYAVTKVITDLVFIWKTFVKCSKSSVFESLSDTGSHCVAQMSWNLVCWPCKPFPPEFWDSSHVQTPGTNNFEFILQQMIMIDNCCPYHISSCRRNDKNVNLYLFTITYTHICTHKQQKSIFFLFRSLCLFYTTANWLRIAT